MALCLSSSLIEKDQFDICSVTLKYLEWYAADGFDTGPTASAVFQDLILAKSHITAANSTSSEETWLSEGIIHKASESVHVRFNGMTAGCNAAHRCAPLAMLHSIPDKALAAYVIADATITHHHHLAGEAAAATALLCRSLIRGTPWDLAMAHMRSAFPWSSETAAALAPIPLAPDDPIAGQPSLSHGGFAPDALRAAVHFAGAGESFEAALAAALRFAGPGNYCPVLVGALAGARWGAAAVPPDMLDHRMAAAVLGRVAAAAEQLASQWAAG
jgi:ADP-ribosylglycohydrolase